MTRSDGEQPAPYRLAHRSFEDAHHPTLDAAGVLPASNDTYKGFKGEGFVTVIDRGGTSDTVDLRPLESTDVTFDQVFEEDLRIITGTNSAVSIRRGAGINPAHDRFRVENIVFSDTTFAGAEEVQAALTTR